MTREITTYKGKPLNDYSKEEIIKILEECVENYEKTLATHSGDLDFFLEVIETMEGNK